MKILGLDYGTKRIGVAISDETQMLARELAIWPAEECSDRLTGLLASEPIERIVIGLPLNMSGEDSVKTTEARKFAEQIGKQHLVPVELVDERLSSHMAEQVAGTNQNIDSLAAQIFLQTYLDQLSSSHEPV